MGVSLHLFALAEGDYAAVTERAEELGFEAVWLADHIVTPVPFALRYPYASNGDPGYREDTPLGDVVALLAHMAARTHRIYLGTGVLVLPLRHPVAVARSWATLQNVSGGRALLGVGAGWLEEEFEALGVDFATRGRTMDEGLDLIERLWSGGVVEHRGTAFDVPPVRMTPGPASPVPLIFGGHGKAAMRRAATRGDGWFGPHVAVDESLRLRERVVQARDIAGATRPFRIFARCPVSGGLSDALRLRDEGFADIVVSPFPGPLAHRPLAEKLARLDDIRTEIDELWQSA